MITESKTPVVKAPATQVVVKSAISAPAESKYGPGKCPVCGKNVMRPKDGGVGSTCFEHAGKIRAGAIIAQSIPEGFVRMSKVCDAAQEIGLTRGSVVKASGGDACTEPPIDEIFRVTYVGRSKYLHPDVMVKGLQILKAGKKAPSTVQVAGNGSTPTKSLVEAALKQAITK